jgi:hypothetical protein
VAVETLMPRCICAHAGDAHHEKAMDLAGQDEEDTVFVCSADDSACLDYDPELVSA